MNHLSKVLVFKIVGTLVFWCLPLLFYPSSIATIAGLAGESATMLLQLLGWAYLALCVGYGFALKQAMDGQTQLSAMWVGVVSNGGGCLLLGYYGLQGYWLELSWQANLILWGSLLSTFVITIGLIHFGLRQNKKD